MEEASQAIETTVDSLTPVGWAETLIIIINIVGPPLELGRLLTSDLDLDRL